MVVASSSFKLCLLGFRIQRSALRMWRGRYIEKLSAPPIRLTSSITKTEPTPITMPRTVSNDLNLFDVMATMPDQKPSVKFVSDQALTSLLATAHLPHSGSHSVKYLQLLHQGDKKSHLQRILFWCGTNSQTVCFWYASKHTSYHADVRVTLC